MSPLVARLPVELEVAVPVHDFRVRPLLSLEKGKVIETQWGHGDDLQLAAGDVQLAWSEFEVFFQGSVTNSVFAALNNLVADYSNGTVDTAQAVADTASLNTALNYVSQQRITIDNSITQLSAASNAVASTQMQLTSTQTNLMQADVAQVSTQLSLAETQQTALEDVISQLGSGSLFQKLA